MKDKRFLELVNLYLDGEISDGEMAELEREIRSSAGRMDQYRRYCRMQKACLVLAEKHRDSVPETQGNVVRLPDARRGWLWGQWWRGGVYAGTAAVAATVILIISMAGPGAPDQSEAATPADSHDVRVVQIPVGEFNRAPKKELRLATLKDQWNALTHVNAVSLPASLATGRTPEIAQTPVITEWPSTLFPEHGPLEFQSRTDFASGAHILRSQARKLNDDGDVEFTTFQFER